MRIVGKVWLKNGAIIESNIDVFESLTNDVVKQEIDNIRTLVSKSFRNPSFHLNLEFGGIIIRGDDCSAVCFKILDEDEDDDNRT